MRRATGKEKITMTKNVTRVRKTMDVSDRAGRGRDGNGKVVS